MEFPDSVEEAAALLGASITRASVDKNDTTPRKVKPPPTGMHPAFAIHETSPLADLMERLYVLRALLRSSTAAIPSAPSILQVLKKILGLSVDVAALRATDRPTPPLLSNAVRKVWVDCVLLCCQGQPQSSLAWIRSMQVVASTHPRSAKAAGGVRIAALQVLHGLKSSPDVRAALRSAGAGEPTFRIAAVHSALFVDDLEEGFRILKLAASDKYPEVRYGAAKLAAEKVISEDALGLALRNIDDEQPYVALAWAQAAAKCISNLEGKKKGQALPWLTSHKAAMEHCVEQFIKVGGELAAARAGGNFSLGGRSVRLGYALILVDLVRLDTERSLEGLGELLKRILRMVDIPDDPKQRLWSSFDAGLVRLFCGRVLREGLAEPATESEQVALMQELFLLLKAETTTTQQKQVILTELSHLVVTLSEGIYAILQENLPTLNKSLADSSRGVRFDAAMLVSSTGTTFPEIGRAFVRSSLNEINDQYGRLLETALSDTKGPDQKEARGLFRRTPKKGLANVSVLRPHQAAIHGHALAISLLVQDLPRGDGGLPRTIMDDVLEEATTLVNSHFDERLGTVSTEATFTCVRAGYSLVCGLMSTGSKGAEVYVEPAMEMWQKTVKATTDGLAHMKPADDLICLDATLTSMVVFLKHCSELILVIPQALNQVTVLLETVFPVLHGPGRLAKVESSPRLDSAVASLLEAFAWLPSGSFPLAADKVFSMASSRIERAVEENVPCSILYSLISKEDSILDAKTLPRACREGQTGGARRIEDSIVSTTADIIPQSDQESVMHLRSPPAMRVLGEDDACFRKSRLLGMFSSDANLSKPPTPLHEVGTWREPIDPSSSAKVRTLDAAIQAFSATFGLKDGKQQQGAMDMLERLVPPFFAQLARTVGINSATMEVDRRIKTRDEDSASAAVANITAVVLCCLQALPLHEATHNVPISLGPPWMNKAKDLLLTLLPSTSTIVRRAAAEGLALLATLGVTEDAHFMQSTVLHSLDEVMQGNKPDGKARTLLALESISAAKSGSLLALACMQRTAHNVARRKKERARGRVLASMTDKMIGKVNEDLPVLQMLTRILPSASCHEFRDYFVVKTYALHSFAVLLTYSARLNSDDFQEENKQLIRKGVELATDNFYEAWTSASADSDRGQETEKVATEAAFLAVIIRLMTLLLPFLEKIEEGGKVALNFSTMTGIALEIHGHHPVVFVEGMAFFEVIQGTTPTPGPLSRLVRYTEHPQLSFLPPAMAALRPPDQREPLSPLSAPHTDYSFLPCRATRASVLATKLLIDSRFPLTSKSNMEIIELLFAATEYVCGSRIFKGGRNLRLVANENTAFEHEALASELCNAMGSLVSFEEFHAPTVTRWILLSRHLLMPFADVESDAEDDSAGPALHKRVERFARLRAISDTTFLHTWRLQLRWQTKCLASQVLAESMNKLLLSELKLCKDLSMSSHFDMGKAQKSCRSESDSTFIVFHLEDLLLVAFKTSSASIEQSELKSLQACSVRFLASLIQGFGPTRDPEHAEGSILDQFLPQILSSLRLAFPSRELIDSDSATTNTQLLVAGCEAVHTLSQSGIAMDEATMKRLKALTLPEDAVSNEIIRPSEFTTASPSGKKLAGYVAKIWVASSLLRDGIRADTPETTGYSVAMASSCCAIDACQMLHNSEMSLTGLDRHDDSKKNPPKVSHGFLFSNENDVGAYAMSTIVGVWSSCARSAAFIFQTLPTNVDDATSEWIDLLTPLFVQGIYDSVDDLLSNPTKAKSGWTAGMNASTILLDCLSGLTILLPLQQSLESSIASVCYFVYDRIIGNPCKGEVLEDTVVAEARTLLESFCRVPWISDKSVDCLLARVLKPLELIEKGDLDLSRSQEQAAVAACLGCIRSLVKNRKGSTKIQSSLLLLIQRQLLSPHTPEALESDIIGLFRCCLEKASGPLQRKIALALVDQRSWKAWAVATSVCDSSVLTESLACMRSELRSDDPLPALSSIHMADETAQGLLAADIVQLMYEMGTRTKSDQKVFAAALKIVLSIYSRLASKPDDLVAFLTVVFEAFISVIRFNGLPNHPANGDPMIGQMSTKAIVHVARTTPTEFKNTLLALTAESKTLLEFSVRADMNDYAVAAVKKKLDLKGFRK